MRTSKQGLAFIAGHEGVVTKAYRDVAGVWTIGIGHTAAAGPPKPRAGMTISRAEAFAILARDLPRYEKRVAAALGPVRQTVFDAAVSFDFNTGAIHRASWVKAYRAGNFAAARNGLMQWTKAGGRTVRGLVRRREAEAQLLFNGRYGGRASEPGRDIVRVYQRQLATLGFSVGAIDGIAGPRTRAAILAYQRTRDHLVDDGIAGSATRASLARDVAARRQAMGGAAAAVTTVAAGGIAALADDQLEPALWVGTGLFLAAAMGVAILAYRNRGAIRQFLTFRKGR